MRKRETERYTILNQFITDMADQYNESAHIEMLIFKMNCEICREQFGLFTGFPYFGHLSLDV